MEDGKCLITEFLTHNAKCYAGTKMSFEINLELQDSPNVIWHEYELIRIILPENRRDMTWKVFDEKPTVYNHNQAGSKGR